MHLTTDLSQARALVIDGNANTRGTIAAQLRELGVRVVQQASRTLEARKHLEAGTFDIVLCEQHFPGDRTTGQELLDDLRRVGMLPFATIFIMLTAEASYTKVVEAAESMLDSYLLKPFTTARLADRIAAARQRKVALQDIYQAIEEQAFASAARLCLLRFNERGDYWLYAARVGAELLLHLAHFDKALKVYQAVAQSEGQPWARLGEARVMLEMGQPHKAKPLLEALLADDPGYADAHDNLARALMEMGRFDEARQAYEAATRLTPASISRLQRHGMLTFYLGEHAAAQTQLEHVVQLGLGSKLFDGQTLVLLGLLRFQAGEHKALQQHLQDLARMSQRHPESVRLRRMLDSLRVLDRCAAGDQGGALEGLQDLAQSVLAPDFDFEAACNLLSVLAALAQRQVDVPDVDRWVRTLGLRFATSKAMAELLMGATGRQPRLCDRLLQCNQEVLKLLEQALAPSLSGEPAKAVEGLLAAGTRSLNAKVIETAWLVLQRYRDRIGPADALEAALQPWRQALGTAYNKPVLGDRNTRQSGGVSLRGMSAPPLAPTQAPAMPALDPV